MRADSPMDAEPPLVAERSVLAAMILDSEAIGRARALLDRSAFYLAAHQHIFDAIVALHDRNEPADLVTLVAELRWRGVLGGVGGPAALTQLMEYAATSANVEQHAAIVNEAARKRALLKLGLEVQQQAEDPTKDSAEIAAKVEASIRQLLIESGPATGSARLTCLADVEPEAVEWHWRWYIPRRMVTLFEGHPDVGKSTVLVDLAARTTCGLPMPDGSRGGEPADVVIAGSEDHLSAVLVPRLRLAGADMTRVHTVTIVEREGERELTVAAEDLAKVEQVCQGLKVGLLIFDPLFAHLPGSVKENSDHHVRRALLPLRALAERLGCAVVCVRHWTKAERPNVLHRGGGSVGIIGAARSTIVAGIDRDDETGERRVLALPKHNLAPAATPSLAYWLVPTAGPWDLDPSRPAHCTVKWDPEPCAVTATELARDPDPVERADRREADAWLREAMAAGPVRASEAQAAGFSEKVMRGARKRVGVEVGREPVTGKGPVGPWWWRSSKSPPDPWPWNEPTKPTEPLAPRTERARGRLANDTDANPLETVPDGQTATRPNGHGTSGSVCSHCLDGGRAIRWSFGWVCGTCHRQITPPPGPAVVEAHGWEPAEGVPR